MPATPKKRKLTIIEDKVKLAHTSHWDLDYLSQADLEAVMGAEPVPDEATIEAAKSATDKASATTSPRR